MALSKTVKTPHGFDCVGAYHKIGNVNIFQKNKMVFSLVVSKSPESVAFEEHTYTSRYDIDGENPIKQAYEHLKELPEFEVAEDC